VKVSDGVRGGILLIILESVAIAIVFAVFLINKTLSVAISAITLLIIIIYFIHFLASFSGNEGKRPFSILLIFITLNVTGIILLFANIYRWTGINYGNEDAIYRLPESIYFAIITFTTVGYGDFHPMSLSARVAACIEALSGYVILGVLVAALINIMRPRA
jgi:D-alanyl-lipoteichoic acid acyltransferase DltB (MBOAT superfamily)